MRSWDDWISYLVIVLSLYLGVSMLVFGFRHPWMTDTERFLHMREALLWQQVSRWTP